MSSPISSPIFHRKKLDRSHRRNTGLDSDETAMIEETLDNTADKVMSGLLSLPMAVTINESIPRENDQSPLPAGSLLWVIRHQVTEVVQFKDELGHDIEESASYNRRLFELLSDRPELDDVRFKTLGEALAHTPRPKQLSCLSSWKLTPAENAASLEENEGIKVLDSLPERGPDGRFYHKVQRLRDFVEYGEPVRVPADGKILFSTSLSGKKGLSLPNILMLKKRNALRFPLRLRLLTKRGKKPKYTLCCLKVEKSFIVRVPNRSSDVDTMRLPVHRVPSPVRIHAHGRTLVRLIGSQPPDEQFDIDRLPRLGLPPPSGLNSRRGRLHKRASKQDSSPLPRSRPMPIPPLSPGSEDEGDGIYETMANIPPSLQSPEGSFKRSSMRSSMIGMPSSPLAVRTGSMTSNTSSDWRNESDDSIDDSASDGESVYTSIDTAVPMDGSPLHEPLVLMQHSQNHDIRLNRLRHYRSSAAGSESDEVYTPMLPGSEVIWPSSLTGSPSSAPDVPLKNAHYWQWKYEQLQKEFKFAQNELEQERRYSRLSIQSNSSRGSTESDIIFDRPHQELIDRLEKSKAARQAAESQIDEMVRLLFSVCDVCGIKFD